MTDAAASHSPMSATPPSPAFRVACGAPRWGAVAFAAWMLDGVVVYWFSDPRLIAIQWEQFMLRHVESPSVATRWSCLGAQALVWLTFAAACRGVWRMGVGLHRGGALFRGRCALACARRVARRTRPDRRHGRATLYRQVDRAVCGLHVADDCDLAQRGARRVRLGQKRFHRPGRNVRGRARRARGPQSDRSASTRRHPRMIRTRQDH